MPHLDHPSNNSTSSIQTFDLSLGAFVEDRGRSTSVGGDSQRTKRASSSYGVALTSTPSQDERTALPSQQKLNNAWRRKSAPSSEYAELLTASSVNFDDLAQRRPGDRSSVRSTSYNDASNRRSQHFEEQFQYKDNIMTQAASRVQRQSPVIAELKTNVIIKDEFTLITDLSVHLANRYQRPDTSIMIRVDHSACLALGGNFEPCYILTISAVPSQMSASTNKRNAALIQKFMTEILSVPADRGVVTFVPIAEENLAMSGVTMLAEIERQDKRNSIKDPNSLKSAIKDASRRSMTFPNGNLKTNGENRSNSNLTATSTSSPSITPPPPTSINDKASSADKDGRPSTAHGSGTHGGFDGLRMNGVSTDMLVGSNSRLPNGRPRTFGGSTPSSSSIQDSIKQDPLPHVSRQSIGGSAQRSSMQRASTSTSTTTKQIVAPKQNGLLAPRPIQNGRTTTSSSSTASAPKSKSISNAPTENRPKNTYLDNISSLTKKSTPVVKADDDDEDDIPLAKTAAGRANTAAKRRSTITATPSMPAAKSSASSGKGDKQADGPLKPPPIPDETRSMSSRLSKRKSFMRMFKRQSVPAWYEQ